MFVGWFQPSISSVILFVALYFFFGWFWTKNWTFFYKICPLHNPLQISDVSFVTILFLCFLFLQVNKWFFNKLFFRSMNQFKWFLHDSIWMLYAIAMREYKTSNLYGMFYARWFWSKVECIADQTELIIILFTHQTLAKDMIFSLNGIWSYIHL